MSDYQYQRRVVCAANSCDGVIVLGARHFDETMRATIRFYGMNGFNPMTSGPTGWQQGFIDQQGVFMTREEAWEVAVAANQIIRRVGGDDTGKLFSENLY